MPATTRTLNNKNHQHHPDVRNEPLTHKLLHPIFLSLLSLPPPLPQYILHSPLLFTTYQTALLYPPQNTRLNPSSFPSHPENTIPLNSVLVLFPRRKRTNRLFPPYEYTQ